MYSTTIQKLIGLFIIAEIISPNLAPFRADRRISLDTPTSDHIAWWRIELLLLWVYFCVLLQIHPTCGCEDMLIEPIGATFASEKIFELRHLLQPTKLVVRNGGHGQNINFETVFHSATKTFFALKPLHVKMQSDVTGRYFGRLFATIYLHLSTTNDKIWCRREIKKSSSAHLNVASLTLVQVQSPK